MFKGLLKLLGLAKEEVAATETLVSEEAVETNAWFEDEFAKVVGKSWNQVVEELTGLKNIVPHLNADQRYYQERIQMMLMLKVKELETKLATLESTAAKRVQQVGQEADQHLQTMRAAAGVAETDAKSAISITAAALARAVAETKAVAQQVAAEEKAEAKKL